MSVKKPSTIEPQPLRKKLRLSRETLKDLSDPRGSVKGDAPNTFCRTCSCARC